MLSGFDVAEHEPPGYRPDAGALVTMLADTVDRLEAMPADRPAVVQLAHCFRGFAAIGFACTVLDREFVPRPLECLPVAEKCANVSLRIITSSAQNSTRGTSSTTNRSRTNSRIPS
ncbi:hypothetical protein [Nocardia sp. NPDC004711]